METVNDTARINLPGGNQNLASRDHLSIDKGSNINWHCVKWIPVCLHDPTGLTVGKKEENRAHF
jgi:hypothetical protein